MSLTIYEENKPLVLQALENGDFDYIEAASEYFETEFFRYIRANRILSDIAKTYPTPREKEEVPLGIYIASDLSMRLHGVHSFNAFPMVVRSGGLVNALGPKAGQKVIHPDTGDVTLACEGYNAKNAYDRETPCDPDFLRKMAKDTDADLLMHWYNRDVVRRLRKSRALSKEGIYIGDASYLFVPDNPKYEGSVCLLFDDHNHPVSRKNFEKMTDERKLRCQRRRCYKMVTLLHTNRKLEYFLFVGVRVISGKASECPVLYELVDAFVEAVGPGVMKRLILDRGFLDGEKIARCKRDHKIDVLIPMKRKMDIYQDAEALFAQPEVKWEAWTPQKPKAKVPPRPRPKAVARRERTRQKTLEQQKAQASPPPPKKTLVRTEVAAIGGFGSWSSCAVPLTVVANRECYADGHEERWYLIDTKQVRNPGRAREEYRLRTAIEERYRHLKCFSDLTDFTSRAFSMVVHQVVFIMLAYSLLQLYLLREGRKDLTGKTPPLIRKQLLPSDSYNIVYFQGYYAKFSAYELIDIVASVSEEARKKLKEKSQRRKRELRENLKNPRPP